MDFDSLAVEVERAVMQRGGRKTSWGEIRFRCPYPDRHANGDAHPSAEYNPAARVWSCTACGASGGLVGGDDPLAPLLGLRDAGPIDPIRLARLQAERDAAAASLAADKAMREVALRDYWAAHERVQSGESYMRVLDALLADGIDRMAAEFFGFEAGRWQGLPALTVPWTVRGQIRAVQYRLMADAPGGRYRWHKGSAATLFNADAVLTPQDELMIVVEGAKKAAALWSHGIIGVCAVPNKHGWKPEYARPFGKIGRVVFALDPDALVQAREAALTVPGARMAVLPAKPDDLLMALRGDVTAFMRYIDCARRP